MEDGEFAGMHELVKLIVSRIRAHPKEFVPANLAEEWGVTNTRWEEVLEEFYRIASEDEVRAVKDELRPLQMNALQEMFLDELMNGDDRRTTARGETEPVRKMLYNTTLGKQAMRAESQILQALQGQPSYAGARLGHPSYAGARLGPHTLGIDKETSSD